MRGARSQFNRNRRGCCLRWLVFCGAIIGRSRGTLLRIIAVLFTSLPLTVFVVRDIFGEASQFPDDGPPPALLRSHTHVGDDMLRRSSSHTQSTLSSEPTLALHQQHKIPSSLGASLLQRLHTTVQELHRNGAKGFSARGVLTLRPGKCLRTSGSEHSLQRRQARAERVQYERKSSVLSSDSSAPAQVTWLVADSRGTVCALSALDPYSHCCRSEQPGSSLGLVADQSHAVGEVVDSTRALLATSATPQCLALQRCCYTLETCVSACLQPAEHAVRDQWMRTLGRSPAFAPITDNASTAVERQGGREAPLPCIPSGSMRGLALPGRSGPSPAFESGWLHPQLDAFMTEANRQLLATATAARDTAAASAPDNGSDSKPQKASVSDAEELRAAKWILSARAFALCELVCRSTSASTWYENRYVGDAHHCYGPPPLSSS
jgi:hypothetical protein